MTLEPDESRHLVSALRCFPGDPVVLADGAGTLADGTVQQTRKGRVEVEIVALLRVARPSSAAVDLALAVLHGQAMDWDVFYSSALAFIGVQGGVAVGGLSWWPQEDDQAR